MQMAGKSGKAGFIQNYHALAGSIAPSAMRRVPIPGITVDCIGYLINYNERTIASDSMSCIAKALEAEVLRGEILVRRAMPGGSPEFLLPPTESSAGTAGEPCFINCIRPSTLSVVLARCYSSGGSAHH